MEKKSYIIPSIKARKMDASDLLAGSPGDLNNEKSDSPQKSKESMFDSSDDGSSRSSSVWDD